MARILLLDFDGPIHSYVSGWQGVDIIPDPPTVDEVTGESSIVWIVRLMYANDGKGGRLFKVCVYSSRSRSAEGVEAMKVWFLKFGMPEPILKELGFPTQKLAAFWTIDDRASQFVGRFADPYDIAEYKPWNK